MMKKQLLITILIVGTTILFVQPGFSATKDILPDGFSIVGTNTGNLSAAKTILAQQNTTDTAPEKKKKKTQTNPRPKKETKDSPGKQKDQAVKKSS